MNRFILLALAGFFLYACAQPAPPPPETPNTSQAVEPITFETQQPKFDVPQGLDLTIKTVTAKGTSPAADKINKFLSDDYKGAMLALGNTKNTEIEKSVADFVADFKASGYEEWSYGLEYDVYASTPQLVTVACIREEFTGGMRPIRRLTLYNFDAATGAPVKALDLFNDVAALRPIVEKQFKIEIAEILKAANGSYAEAGFFNGGEFDLPQNIGFYGLNVLFHYNIDEIAPYTMGETYVVIPRKNIAHLLKYN